MRDYIELNTGIAIEPRTLEIIENIGFELTPVITDQWA
jgi:hypothetical protein